MRFGTFILKGKWWQIKAALAEKIEAEAPKCRTTIFTNHHAFTIKEFHNDSY